MNNIRLSTFGAILVVGALFTGLFNATIGVVLWIVGMALVAGDMYFLFWHRPSATKLQQLQAKQWRYKDSVVSRANAPRWLIKGAKGNQIIVDTEHSRTPPLEIPYQLFLESFEEY